MSKSTDSRSARQRHLSSFSEYTRDIWHIEGKNNCSAAALSQTFVGNVQNGISYEALAESQQQGSLMRDYKTAVTGYE